jgi:hypothetical protein
MAEIQTSKIEALLETLQGITPEEMQSGEDVRQHLISLTSWLAWTGEQMALANKSFNIAKRDAYHRLQQDFENKGVKLSPMLAKDYIGSLCSKEAYSYEIAERANRTCFHCIEAFRSVLSSLKQEQQSLGNAA